MRSTLSQRAAVLSALLAIAGCSNTTSQSSVATAHTQNSATKQPNSEKQGTPPTAQTSTAWQTTLDADHALVGKVWVREKNSLFASNSADVAAIISSAKVLLLGEKHDNPDHHRLQAQLLNQWISGPASVAFEMIDIDEQSILDPFNGKPAPAIDELQSALQWSKRGWPDFSMYYPVFQATFSKAIALGANYPRTKIRALAKQGENGVEKSELERLGVLVEMPEPLKQSLSEELVESHCGHMPASRIPAMMLMQRAKDGQMADVINTELAKGKKVALIAGAGHTRRDRGVGWILQNKKVNQVLSIGFIEVHKELTSPEQYAKQYSSTTLPFDLVFFTPRLDDKDPCEGFRK